MTLSLFRAALASIVLAATASAVPVIGPPVSQATFLRPEFGQYGIARGAMFAVFGQEMGPAVLVSAPSFPLPTELEGTSVQVTVEGVTVDCIMVFTSAGQLAAILPSTTPVGDGTMTVAYNGETSESVPIRVLENGIGIFTVRQDGQGPGVITDVGFQVNSPVLAHQPGERAIAWITGLGPRENDDVSEVEDLRGQFNLEVFVGNEQAETFYAGPSGCCGAVDVVHFNIPANAAVGCFVPVFMRIGESISNFVTMSIVSEGRTCGDPHGLPAEMIDRIFSQGSIRIGFFVVTSLSSNQVFVNAVPATGALRIKPQRVAQSTQEELAPFAGSATLRVVEQTAQNYWYGGLPIALGTSIGGVQVDGVDPNRFAAVEVPLSGSAELTLMGPDGPIATAPMVQAGNVLTSGLIDAAIWTQVEEVMLQGGVAVGDQSLVRVAQTAPLDQGLSNLGGDQTSVRSLVNARAIDDLPLNGRNVLQLATLQPGSTEAAINTTGSGTTYPEAWGHDTYESVQGIDSWAAAEQRNQTESITEISGSRDVYDEAGNHVGSEFNRFNSITPDGPDDEARRLLIRDAFGFSPGGPFIPEGGPWALYGFGAASGSWTVRQYPVEATRGYDTFSDILDTFHQAGVTENDELLFGFSSQLNGVGGAPYSGACNMNCTLRGCSASCSYNVPSASRIVVVEDCSECNELYSQNLDPGSQSVVFGYGAPAAAATAFHTLSNERLTRILIEISNAGGERISGQLQVNEGQ